MAFVRAGRAYIDTIETSYPSEGDRCAFCLQKLGPEHTELIHAYWDLLKGKAAAELETARNVVAKLAQEIRAVEPVVFNESLALYEHIKAFDGDLAERWKSLADRYEQAKTASLSALEKLDTASLPAELAGLSSEFDPCKEALGVQRKELIDSNTTEEISRLTAQLAFLEDRELLAKIKDRVVLYIESGKWVDLAQRKHGELLTTGITRRQGALYDEHVTAEYVESFNTESKALGAPNFVSLDQRNERASTLRRLTISDHNAIKVLSEGEQRAISIADFITESTLNPTNRGVIFDDPVSSQDHERKEKIAARLVELAKARQVIVFTHDIAFFSRLLGLADQEGVDLVYNYIKKIGDAPGVVEEDLPWLAKGVRARVGMLKQELVRLKKVEQAGDPDEYLFAAKQWYSWLRETWERTVEERVFKGVVERFAPGVQTQRLKKVVITDNMIAEVEKGMTNSSSWVHDAASGLNPTPPDTERAEQDLNDLDTFIQNCPAP